jgi:hypothetical protein
MVYKEEDYKQFEESLKDEDEYAKENNARAATNDSKKDEQSNEIRVGIKNWLVNFLNSSE